MGVLEIVDVWKQCWSMHMRNMSNVKQYPEWEIKRGNGGAMDVLEIVDVWKQC